MESIKILYLICYCVTGFIVFDFLKLAFKKKYQNRLYYIFACLLFVIGYAFIGNQHNMLINFIFGAVTATISGYILYDKYAKKALYIFLFIVYLTVVDTLGTLIGSSTQSLQISTFSNDFRSSFISILAVQALMLTTYQIVGKLLMQKSFDRVTCKETIFQFSFLAFQVIAIFLSAYFIQEEMSQIFLFFLTLGFIGSDIYIIYLFRNLSEHNLLKERHALEIQQQNILNQYYRDIDLKYEQSRKHLHDMKQHIQMIERLHKNKDDYEGTLYAKNVYKQMENFEYKFQCSNKILTVIINDAIQRAEIKHINFEVNVKTDAFNFLDNIDITTLFSNILNNAIEACEILEGGNRWIKLNIQNINENIVIYSANSCLESFFLVENRKTSKVGHAGIGITNIFKVVENYGGICDMICSNYIFEVKISIPLP